MCRVFAILGHFQFRWSWALSTQFAFSSIQFTHERKYMHGCRYGLNGTETTSDGSQCLDFMYDQTLGWSYVNTPGMQWRGKQRWHQASECRHVYMFKNEYWFRFVSVHDMHETSGFRHRSDRTNKTRITWQLQWNEGILHKPCLRTTKRPTLEKMRRPVLD
jgi:hypothetical protein